MIHQNQFHVSLKQIWKTNKGRSENSQISFWQHQEAISPVKTIQKKRTKKKIFLNQQIRETQACLVSQGVD